MNNKLPKNIIQFNKHIIHVPSTSVQEKDMYVKLENITKTISEFEQLRTLLVKFDNLSKSTTNKNTTSQYTEKTKKIIKKMDDTISILKDNKYAHIVNMADIKNKK